MNEIASRVDALGAELRYVAHTGWFGSGVIFEGDVDPAISSVRTWSGVASASRVGLFTVQLTDVQAQALAVFARVEIAEAVPGDQSIQALAGDSVTMIYRPSVGMDLTAGFVMCEVVTTGDVLEGGLGDIPPCT